jgi:solute carrier family 45 protein 1/2/4
MMAWSTQWAVLGPLLEILVSSSGVQLVQLVGPTCGLLVVPAIGVLSDNCASRYGRRRPFMFWGAIASSLSWVLLMFANDLGRAFGDTFEDRTWTAGITIFCYIWMDITLNIAMVPAGLIMADFAGKR